MKAKRTVDFRLRGIFQTIYSSIVVYDANLKVKIRKELSIKRFIGCDVLEKVGGDISLKLIIFWSLPWIDRCVQVAWSECKS